MTDRNPLPPPRLTLPAARQSETYVGVGHDANRARPPLLLPTPIPGPHVDLEQVGKTASAASSVVGAVKVVGGMVVGAALCIGSGYAWAKSLAPKAYVDDAVRLAASAAIAVDGDHEKRLQQIDLRIEKLLTVTEMQSKTLDSHDARIRDCEARRGDAMLVRGR